MTDSRLNLVRKILLTIDQNPSSIYDIQYSLLNASDPRRNRLPKLLKSMEIDRLIVSAIQPGPLGPYRRIYELGPRSQDYLNEVLRDAIETLLHSYRAFRRQNPEGMYNLGEEPKHESPSGTILFVSFPNFTTDDLRVIRNLLSTIKDISIAVIGLDDILGKTAITYEHMGMEITSIDAQSESISEIHVHGVPPQNELLPALEECKRVLFNNGLLKITAPFVFFDETESPSLENFIRITAISLFPELGIVNGNTMRSAIKSVFSTNGDYETQDGEVVFWGVKH